MVAIIGPRGTFRRLPRTVGTARTGHRLSEERTPRTRSRQNIFSEDFTAGAGASHVRQIDAMFASQPPSFR